MRRAKNERKEKKQSTKESYEQQKGTAKLYNYVFAGIYMDFFIQYSSDVWCNYGISGFLTKQRILPV